MNSSNLLNIRERLSWSHPNVYTNKAFSEKYQNRFTLNWMHNAREIAYAMQWQNSIEMVKSMRSSRKHIYVCMHIKCKWNWRHENKKPNTNWLGCWIELASLPSLKCVRHQSTSKWIANAIKIMAISSFLIR